MLFNHFTLDLIEQLRLGLWLEEVVGSFFFFQDILLSLSEILGTIESVHPPSALTLVLFPALIRISTEIATFCISYFSN